MATSRVVLPPGAELEVWATAGEVLVERWSGALVAVTTGDHDVILGPVDGRVDIETEAGAVTGHGLAATRVDVRTVDGAVHLSFREPPRSVSVEAGDGPVTIELPPGRYAVTVEGSHSPVIELDNDGVDQPDGPAQPDSTDQAGLADRSIRVVGRGPVRIHHTT